MLRLAPGFFDEVVPFPDFLLTRPAFTPFSYRSSNANAVMSIALNLGFFPVHFFPFIQQLNHPRFSVLLQRLRFQGEKTTQLEPLQVPTRRQRALQLSQFFHFVSIEHENQES